MKMKTTNLMSEKRSYSSPQIKEIKLDNEISLTLDSNIAPGDPEASLSAPGYFNFDPFKSKLS
jgi:hypothetical protein